jgi:hypothetical protein
MGAWRSTQGNGGKTMTTVDVLTFGCLVFVILYALDFWGAR